MFGVLTTVRLSPGVRRLQEQRANRALMNQMGVEPWLRRLLEVLETGGATGAQR